MFWKYSTWSFLNSSTFKSNSKFCSKPHFHLSYSYCGHQKKGRELSYLKDWKLTATCSLTINQHPLTVETGTIPLRFPIIARRIQIPIPGGPATGSTSWIPIFWIFHWWGTDGFIFASYIWFYGWGTGHDFTITLDSQGLISERK